MWAAEADVWRLGELGNESEIKVVYTQTSEPSTKALIWESDKSENVHPQNKKTNKKPYKQQPSKYN